MGELGAKASGEGILGNEAGVEGLRGRGLRGGSNDSVLILTSDSGQVVLPSLQSSQEGNVVIPASTINEPFTFRWLRNSAANICCGQVTVSVYSTWKNALVAVNFQGSSSMVAGVTPR